MGACTRQEAAGDLQGTAHIHNQLQKIQTGRSVQQVPLMFGGGGGYGQKIDADVAFPLESLDLTKHVIGSDAKGENLIYDLYAISNHYGNMGFGHYTAYCQNPVTNQWYEFDDSRVSQVNVSMLKSSICTND